MGYTLVGAAEVLQAGKAVSDKVRNEFRRLARPAVGNMEDMRQALQQDLGPRTAFGGLNEVLDGKMLRSVIKGRNDMVHGGEPSELQAETMVREWNQYLETSIRRYIQKVRLKLRAGLALHYDGESISVDGIELNGVTPAFQRVSWVSEELIVTKRVHLVQQGREPEGTLYLHPWIVLERAIEPNCWRVLIFDGYEAALNKLLTGAEEIRYVDIWSLKRTAGEQAYYLKDIAMGNCTKALF